MAEPRNPHRTFPRISSAETWARTAETQIWPGNEEQFKDCPQPQLRKLGRDTARTQIWPMRESRTSARNISKNVLRLGRPIGDTNMREKRGTQTRITIISRANSHALHNARYVTSRARHVTHDKAHTTRHAQHATHNMSCTTHDTIASCPTGSQGVPGWGVTRARPPTSDLAKCHKIKE